MICLLCRNVKLMCLMFVRLCSVSVVVLGSV